MRSDFFNPFADSEIPKILNFKFRNIGEILAFVSCNRGMLRRSRCVLIFL